MRICVFETLWLQSVNKFYQWWGYTKTMWKNKGFCKHLCTDAKQKNVWKTPKKVITMFLNLNLTGQWQSNHKSESNQRAGGSDTFISAAGPKRCSRFSRYTVFCFLSVQKSVHKSTFLFFLFFPHIQIFSTHVQTRTSHSDLCYNFTKDKFQSL